MTEEVKEVMVVTAPEQQGRRDTDWVSKVFLTVRRESMKILEIWEDERGKWSTRRLLLWWWTALGSWLMIIEATAKVEKIGNVIIQRHFLNNAWITAWQVTEGAFIIAVFGPVVADYLKNAMPAIANIASSVRSDKLEAIIDARRDKAAAVGSEGTEYTE